MEVSCKILQSRVVQRGGAPHFVVQASPRMPSAEALRAEERAISPGRDQTLPGRQRRARAHSCAKTAFRRLAAGYDEGKLAGSAESGDGPDFRDRSGRFSRRRRLARLRSRQGSRHGRPAAQQVAARLVHRLDRLAELVPGRAA